MRTSLAVEAITVAYQAGLIAGNAIMHTDRGSQGGFNWSSQHFDLGGMRRGHGGLEFEDQRCSGGAASAVAR
jgi:hypothetical protein